MSSLAQITSKTLNIAQKLLGSHLPSGSLTPGEEIEGKATIAARYSMSPRQIEIMLAGGLINWVRAKRGAQRLCLPGLLHRLAAAET